MTSESLTIENELDIRKLCQVFWRGKLWIVGLAVIFSGIALLYSYLVKQEWVSVSIMTKPSITALGPYYDQQQFLINAGSLDSGRNIADNVYREFLQQANSYDTRRDFWLQSQYYLQRKEGDNRADTVLLYEFIDNITLTLSNSKSPADSIQMVAETGADAQTLLNEYVNFAAVRTVAELNQELGTLWAEKQRQLSVRMAQLKASADADYQRQINSLKQTITATAAIEPPKKGSLAADSSADGYDDSLKRELEYLVSSGPQLGDEYYQGQVLLTRLSEPLKLESFQAYRFLRTPDEPVTRSKPRRLFLIILWGAIGGFCGAGIALTRRKNLKISYNS